MFAVRRTLAASLFVVAAAGAATLPARGDGAKAPASPPAPAAVPTAPAAKEAAAPPSSTPSAPSGKLTITTDAGTLGCKEQAAQAFLIRGNWFPRTNDAEKQKEG